jgi:magnesium transporter
MILTYSEKNNYKAQEITTENHELLKAALWIDVYCPTPIEEKMIEDSLAIDIPTREEMLEIEVSSRLFKDEGTLFMTATMLAQTSSLDPQFDAVSFVLTERQLITIRYIDPQSFKLFAYNLEKYHYHYEKPAALLVDLLDAVVDRLADIIEAVGRNFDQFSKMIFRPTGNNASAIDYQVFMQKIGANGDINTKAHESLMTFNRLIIFLGQKSATQTDTGYQQQLGTLTRDIDSLKDHATFLSNKVNFLLDATLGMVSIEQNKIIKIFSVAAVIFLPPTLIASIYGMNFKFMPELSWHGGYFFAIGLMLLSAWLPYKYFKRRKWL